MFKRLLFTALLGSVFAFAGGSVKSIDEQSFTQETRSGTVLVDFYWHVHSFIH